MIKTVVIDAQKQDRDRVTRLLSEEDEIKVLARGKDGYDALKLIGSIKPDIAVMGNQLEFIEGDAILPLLKARSPTTSVVILAGKISDYQLFRAASNKVSGFVHKETDLEILPEALKFISSGGCFISPSLAARILRLFSFLNAKHLNFPAFPESSRKNQPVVKISARDDPVGQLSKTELSILTCISKGLTSEEIALQLNLAVGTVRNYVSSIMKKLGLKSRTQLVRYTFDYCLITPEKGGNHLFI